LKEILLKFLLASIAMGVFMFAAAPAAFALTITPIDGQPVGAAAYVGIAKDFGNVAGTCTTCTPLAASYASDPGGVTSPTQLLFPDNLQNNQTSASATNSFSVPGGSGQGDASADLATGLLKVLARSTGSIVNPKGSHRADSGADDDQSSRLSGHAHAADDGHDGV
jgi:hypothetical protein